MISNEIEKMVDIRRSINNNEINEKIQSCSNEQSVDVVDYAISNPSHGFNNLRTGIDRTNYDTNFRQLKSLDADNATTSVKNINNNDIDYNKPYKVVNQCQFLTKNQQSPNEQISQPHLWTSPTDKRIPIFQFPRKKSDPSCVAKEKPKFNKCATIARLFGNTYSTQQSIHPPKDAKLSSLSSIVPISRNITKTERFKKCPENLVDNGGIGDNDNCSNSVQFKDFCDEKDSSGHALRSLSKSIGRLWRKSHSVEISAPDPEYKVPYLGNVLTGWAKGESCVEKPLATLWRNYTQNHKPDVLMRILVCSSGLKATTRQHGLTEYWSNRITHCSSPKNYPRIFCWIYRHEGRKLKHELRCHAVLCPKESIAEQICQLLKENLSRALKEFKRDKMCKQNARLSLVNSVYDNPSMPRRKILLSVGANNYRPPMERSKSAPKLMAIEEAVGEEDDDTSMSGVKELHRRPSCCNVDPLFPAMTLGRKHCRRGHSIRKGKLDFASGANWNSLRGKSEKIRSVSFDDQILTQDESESYKTMPEDFRERETQNSVDLSGGAKTQSNNNNEEEDEDDFNSLLMINDYDAESSLSGELMSYFDLKLKLKSAVSMSDLHTTPNDIISRATDLSQRGNRITLSLDNLDLLTDECSVTDTDNYFFDDKNTFYNQNEVIDSIVTASTTETSGKSQTVDSTPNHNIFIEKDFFDGNVVSHTGDESTLKTSSNTINLENFNYLTGAKNNKLPTALIADSDEGSISSGCETSSTATSTHFDDIIRSEKDLSQSNELHFTLNGKKIPIVDQSIVPMPSNNINNQNRNETKVFLSNCTIDTAKRPNIITLNNSTNHESYNIEEDCNSEVSDESGFDEYQNFIGRNTNGFNRHGPKDTSINKNHIGIDILIDDTNNRNKNNNNDYELGENNKAPNRLMINIPKNAKSILI